MNCTIWAVERSGNSKEHKKQKQKCKIIGRIRVKRGADLLGVAGHKVGGRVAAN